MITDLVVRCGTAEQLARLWFLRKLSVPTDHVDDLVSFLIGHVGGHDERQTLWRQLDAELDLLWTLLEGDWTPDELDELSEDEWERHHFPTAWHETQHRWRVTRERVAAHIEGAIRLARYDAAEARRNERAQVAS